MHFHILVRAGRGRYGNALTPFPAPAARATLAGFLFRIGGCKDRFDIRSPPACGSTNLDRRWDCASFDLTPDGCGTNAERSGNIFDIQELFWFGSRHVYFLKLGHAMLCGPLISHAWEKFLLKTPKPDLEQTRHCKAWRLAVSKLVATGRSCA